MAHDVFICHSSKDKKIADAICAKLEQHQIRCWIAPRDVTPGRDFAEEIIAAIHASKVTVFVFSGNSNASPHVSHELERTVSLGHPVLPFRVEEVVPSPALEYFISSAHWLDALTPPMERHIDRLATTVAALLEREAPPTAAPPPAPTPTPRRNLVVVLAVLAVLGAVGVGLVLALGRGHDAASPGTTTSATPTTTSSTTTTPSSGPTAAPFTDDFTHGVGAGWTWKNEDAGAWRVTPQGWLEIDAQDSPPYRNLLLRDIPGASYHVKVRLRYPTTASGFAGVVLMGDDPGTRLEFGLTKEGLSANEYKNGSLVAGSMMYTRDLNVGPDRDIRLILSVDRGGYRTQYYDRQAAQYLDFGSGATVLSSAYTRVGLAAFGTIAAAGTADFDSFEIY